jgi:hypothetical protein
MPAPEKGFRQRYNRRWTTAQKQKILEELQRATLAKRT